MARLALLLLKVFKYCQKIRTTDKFELAEAIESLTKSYKGEFFFDELCQKLESMLHADEAKRPDFLTLKSWITQMREVTYSLKPQHISETMGVRYQSSPEASK